MSLLVLVEWPYVVGVLWGPVAQLSWSPELGAPGVPAPPPHLSHVHPPVAVEH